MSLISICLCSSGKLHWILLIVPLRLDINVPASLLQGSSMKASDGASDGGEPVVNVEGQMYVDSKSYVMVEICLNRPLVPKRQPEELAKK